MLLLTLYLLSDRGKKNVNAKVSFFQYVFTAFKDFLSFRLSKEVGRKDVTMLKTRQRSRVE